MINSHCGWLNLRANKSDIGIFFRILSTRSGWFALSISTIKWPVRCSFLFIEVADCGGDNDNSGDDELDGWADLNAMLAPEFNGKRWTLLVWRKVSLFWRCLRRDCPFEISWYFFLSFMRLFVFLKLFFNCWLLVAWFVRAPRVYAAAHESLVYADGMIFWNLWKPKIPILRLGHGTRLGKN